MASWLRHGCVSCSVLCVKYLTSCTITTQSLVGWVVLDLTVMWSLPSRVEVELGLWSLYPLNSIVCETFFFWCPDLHILVTVACTISSHWYIFICMHSKNIMILNNESFYEKVSSFISHVTVLKVIFCSNVISSFISNYPKYSSIFS